MKLKGHTPNAMLGLLTFHPMSGYDIRQLVPESIGHFWSESYGQIYPALKSLTAAGLVKKKAERRKGKPDRNVYSITETGRNQLTAWLGVAAEVPVPRNELLLKVFFGAHADLSVSRQHVLAHRDGHMAALKLYKSMVRKLKQEEVDDPQLPFWLMTLSYGRLVCAATVTWCNETLRTLDGMEKTRIKASKAT